MSIYTVVSDLENSKKLSNGLRNRFLDQSLLYQNEGAGLYYQAMEEDEVFIGEDKSLLSNDDFLIFGEKNIFKFKKPITLVSLGCGKSHIEKKLLDNTNGDNTKYLGVDSSQKMLKLSDNLLKNTKIDYSLICADFSLDNFQELINDFTGKKRKKVFSFFSNTFGNIYHTNIIDILFNILTSGEQIWLDVRLKKDNTTSSHMDIFNLHELKENSTQMEKTFEVILNEAGIPMGNGYFSKKMKNEEGINALRISFDFIFTEKTIINVKGQITFLPQEQLRCLQIYYYDSESLVNFFSEHGFKLIDKQEKYMRGQFLFEKE